MKNSPSPSCSKASTSRTDSKVSKINNRLSSQKSSSSTSSSSSSSNSIISFRILPSNSSCLCFITVIAIALLTAPVTTSALPIQQSLSNNNDLILNDNTNVFQSQIPIESVTSLPSSIESKRHTRRSLRRILRSVENEIVERGLEPVADDDDSAIIEPSPSSETPTRRDRRSDKKSYPRICYFSPIQCIFTRAN